MLMFSQNNRRDAIYRVSTLMILFFYTFAFCNLFAADDIVVKANTDRTKILIGDVFNYTLIVEWAAGIELSRIEPPMALGAFEIRDYQPSETKKITKEKYSKTINFKLSTYDTGEYEIPAFDIKYKTKDGIEKSIKSAPIKIVVEGIKTSEAEKRDIGDIKLPVMVKADTLVRNLIIICALFLIIIASILYYFLIYRRKLKAMADINAIEAFLPPDEEAIKSLEELAKSTYFDEGKYKVFYSTLSSIIKRYISRRYLINAIDMTTYELTYVMKKKIRLSENIRARISDILNECDLVKFAKFVPDASRKLIVIDAGRGIVEETKEVKAPESGSVVAKEVAV